MNRGGRRGLGLLKVIQQRGQPWRILQKEPSQHRLKSCGLPVPGRIAAAGPPAGPIAATPHQILFPRGEQGLKSSQSFGLGLRPHLAHHGAMQIGPPARLAALAQPLVQFPDGIAEPGELQGAKLLRTRLGDDARQPARCRSGFRRR
jgi:hypothetical protein